MQEYAIGCSGYYYPAWKNKFYPAEIPPREWLPYYSTIFNTVELNGTFYRTPKLNDLKKYAAVTPKEFTFSVKMSRRITHNLRLKESKIEIAAFQNLMREGLADKLAYFLFQLPPSFHYNEENLERIVNNIPNNPQSIVEFRHLSWWNDDVKKVFKDAQLSFCNIDFPGLDTYFIQTSPVFYLRLHGNPELFKSAYDSSELEDFYNRFPAGCQQYTIYFNNTYYEAGYTNALALLDIIKTAALAKH